MKTILVFLSLFFSVSILAQDMKPPKSARQAIVVGQQLVDAGELDRAIPYLKIASDQFPDNDTVIAMYGQALYEAREIRQAEDVFRQALTINPLNRVAKTYVEEIRETSAASVSLEYQQIREVALDKFGDIIVLALGFLLANLTGGFISNFTSKRFMNKARKHFMDGRYDDFADLLEIQLTTNELKTLRNSLDFMLEHKTLAEAVKILQDYVNTEENLNTLKRMITLLEAKRDVA